MAYAFEQGTEANPLNCRGQIFPLSLMGEFPEADFKGGAQKVILRP